MQGFRQEGDALLWEQMNEVVRIEPWGADSVRVRAAWGAPISVDETLSALLPPPPPVSPQIEIGVQAATLRHGALTAELRLLGGPAAGMTTPMLRFFNSATGAELVAEVPTHFPRPPARLFRPLGGDLCHVELRLRGYADEKLYGLGQHQHGRLNQKGLVIDQLQRNTEVCIPFVLSSRGYGFLWNNPAVGRVELGHDQTRWVAEATRQLDYWITAGETPAQIQSHYADATGHAPMLPEWAAGFWQCKLRYRTQEELMEVAREHQRRGLPLEVIVSDFFHWSMQGDWQFDPVAWPDPAAMVAELEAMGVKLMVSIWPSVNANSTNYAELMRRGLLLRTKRGGLPLLPFIDTTPPGVVHVMYYDATNPEARDFIWQKVRQGYYRHGIKVWWLDACEPEMNPTDPDNLHYYVGDGLAVANIYPMLHARGFYEGMRGEGEEEIISLCRSAWAGSQRYGAAVWSGDIQSTFESLRTQVRAGLNIGLSGIPWWTTDIGGFFGGDPDSPAFRELLVRWFQYGVFCPLCRLHGYRLPYPTDPGNLAGGPNEVWSYGEEVYAILCELLFLRRRLQPYVLAQMKTAQETGLPPMRPLFVDFPDDPLCWEVEDQFLLGPDLLVAPVLEAGATSRRLYLPEGATWTDGWTGVTLPGGQWITTQAPLDRIPLYLRDGAVLPIIGETQAVIAA